MVSKAEGMATAAMVLVAMVAAEVMTPAATTAARRKGLAMTPAAPVRRRTTARPAQAALRQRRR
ncbi:hypothetical protein, partial [Mesorhizobium sp. M7A.F.Ca.CA.004.09.1.2]|uniref:hypothetical protein n=1 Tax=Mesorhizobium sp. M7A.F.Ca.CA.004.09.1.2 TaxID=2496695 RepID=UPI0019CFDEEE